MRAPKGSRQLAVRWPVPVGALAAGCGLAVLVYQAGAVPLPTRHSNPTASGPVAHLQIPASADAPPRTVLRPADVTQQLLVAVQLAPAAANSGLHVSSHATHVVAAAHHTVLLALGSHPALTDLNVGTSSPVSDTTTTVSDPGTTATAPGTTPTDTGTTTTGTTPPDTTGTTPPDTTGTTPPDTTGTTPPDTTGTTPPDTTTTTTTTTTDATATTTTTATTTDATPPPAV